MKIEFNISPKEAKEMASTICSITSDQMIARLNNKTDEQIIRAGVQYILEKGYLKEALMVRFPRRTDELSKKSNAILDNK